jgi:hypothetical protein
VWLGLSARRVLITGVSTYWGGRLAQALERDRSVEAIIGVSPDDPTCELDRTEFVRVGTQHALLRRIVPRGPRSTRGRHAPDRRQPSPRRPAPRTRTT